MLPLRGRELRLAHLPPCPRASRGGSVGGGERSGIGCRRRGARACSGLGLERCRLPRTSAFVIRRLHLGLGLGQGFSRSCQLAHKVVGARALALRGAECMRLTPLSCRRLGLGVVRFATRLRLSLHQTRGAELSGSARRQGARLERGECIRMRALELIDVPRVVRHLGLQLSDALLEGRRFGRRRRSQLVLGLLALAVHCGLGHGGRVRRLGAHRHRHVLTGRARRRRGRSSRFEPGGDHLLRE